MDNETEGSTDQLIQSGDIDFEFGTWLAQAVGSLDERAVRATRLARLMMGSGPLSTGSRQSRDATTPTSKVPAALAGLIESQARLRQASSKVREAGKTVYIFPAWLLAGQQGYAPFGLRVTLHGTGPQIFVANATGKRPESRKCLEGIMLRAQRSSTRRQKRLARTASAILNDLEIILGSPPSASSWLLRMLDDPGSAERQVLGIWNDFVSGCNLPLSFRGKRALSLSELRVLRRGEQGGRHRQSFAEQQPWAAGEVLRGPDPHRVLKRVDGNPANAIEIAAQLLCCSEDRSCEKSLRFSRALAKHRNNPAVDRILGHSRESQADRQFRSVLLQAHHEDGGELLSHMGSPQRMRRQIRRSLDLYWAFRNGTDGSHICSYRLATLAIRVMVRSGLDPQDLDPQGMASSFAALSADCLAAHVADGLDRSLACPNWEESEADTLDLGVLAFVTLLGGTRRPGITGRQLVRFAGAACHGVHRIEHTKDESLRVGLLHPGGRLKHIPWEGRASRR